MRARNFPGGPVDKTALPEQRVQELNAMWCGQNMLNKKKKLI